MEYVKLNTLCEINIGKTPSRNKSIYWGSGNKWLAISDLKEKYIYKSKEEITDIAVEESNMKLVPKDTVIMSFKLSIGKVAILKEDMFTNEAIANFKIKDKSLITPEYLYYALKTLNFNNTDRAVMGATLNKSKLNDIKIPYCDIETQKKIVEVLDKAQELIDKRKEQIKAMDELVKSRFIEMFGKGDYQIVKTEDICEFITKGTTPKSNEIFECYTEGFIPYLKVYNLSFDGTMLFNDNPQYVTRDTHNGFLARSKVFPNDVLMNIVGPPLGKFSLVPSDFDEWNINQAIAIFRATDKVKPIYLLHALKQPNVLRPFIDSAVGVRQQNISLSQCRNIEIPLPPIELQNEFADFVNQVDKLKSQMENSLKELEDNFKSLMQKAFKGELF